MNILLLAELSELEDYLAQKGHNVKKTTWKSFTEEKIGKDITFKEALKEYHLIICLFQKETEGLLRYIKRECPQVSFFVVVPVHLSLKRDIMFTIEAREGDGCLVIAPDFVSDFECCRDKLKLAGILNSTD